MSTFEEVAGVLAAAAEFVHPGAVIAQADELRECLRFLEAAGVPAVDAFGDLTSQCATDLDETAARMAELQENLMAAARRVAAGQGVTG